MMMLIPGTEKAEGSMERQDMVYAEQQELFENKFVKKGYTFAGWNTKKQMAQEMTTQIRKW